MNKKYEVWVAKKIWETDDKDAADECAFLEWADEPAPDKYRFMEVGVRVREEDDG